MTPRLKTRLRVQAALREAQTRGSFGAVVRAGDDDAGAVLLLLRARDGLITVLGEARTDDGAPAWVVTAGGQPLDPVALESYTARQIERDPDLWVVEFDAENGRPPFEAVLLPPRHGG